MLNQNKVDIKINLIIVAFGDAKDFLEKFEKFFYNSNVNFIIHWNKRDIEEFKKLEKSKFYNKPNVFFFSEVEVYWGHISIVDAQIASFKKAIEIFPVFDYVICVDNRTIPSKSWNHIFDILKVTEGNWFNFNRKQYLGNWKKWYKGDFAIRDCKNKTLKNNGLTKSEVDKIYEKHYHGFPTHTIIGPNLIMSQIEVKKIINSKSLKSIYNEVKTHHAPEEHFFTLMYLNEHLYSEIQNTNNGFYDIWKYSMKRNIIKDLQKDKKIMFVRRFANAKERDLFKKLILEKKIYK